LINFSTIYQWFKEKVVRAYLHENYTFSVCVVSRKAYIFLKEYCRCYCCSLQSVLGNNWVCWL